MDLQKLGLCVTRLKLFIYVKKRKTIQAKHDDLNSTEVLDTLNVFTALLSLS